MAASQPGPRYTGLWQDPVNGRLAFYYKGTRTGYFTASAFQVESGITSDFDGVVNFDGAVDMDSTVDMTGGTAKGVVQVAILGSVASLASNGASGAILPDVHFVAPYDLQIVSAWAMNQTKSDVTVGTAVSETSYRRINLITNTAGTGSGTNIVASLNATASAASLVTRAFTIAASTVPAGAIVLASQLTVGAATADGTDMAERMFSLSYMRV